MEIISFDNWFLFPISVGIATVAMSSGIGGAVFFSPLFLLGLRLSPTVAIGCALITELFGFTSGVISYSKAKLIDYNLAKSLMIFSIPSALFGSLVVDYFPPDILKAVFATGLIAIGWQLYSSYRAEEKEKASKSIQKDVETNYENELMSADGKVFRYTICNKAMGRFFAAIGGFFVGMISVGLAELQEYHLVARCRIPPPVAIATSIFVVVFTVLIASLGHIYHFVSATDQQVLHQVINVVVFTIPGVIIGGQIGPLLQRKVNPDLMRIVIAVLFVGIGGFMLFTLIG